MKTPFLSFRPLLYCKVYVCFTPEDWAADDDWTFPWPLEGDDDNVGVCIQCSNGEIAIAINPAGHKTFPDLIDTIAHESQHAMGKVFKYMGDREPSEEMKCIVTGRIAGFVMQEYLNRYFREN